MIDLHTSLDNIPEAAQGAVLAIGNFDGVHLGHRALIEKAKFLADEAGAPFGILTFEPHPRQFFKPDTEPFRLTLPPMKQRILDRLGVDHLFAVKFDAAFSQITGEEFSDRILAHNMKISRAVVGEGFVFGRDRSGTTDMLAASRKFNFTAVPPAANAEGCVYSSTGVRELLKQGKFQEAEKMLGWPWQIEAPVIHGDKRGRLLGFPTANQNVQDYTRIPFGVYAVKILIEGETRWRNGAANFGIRPMFQLEQPILETFIFDFSGDIYDKMVRVRPVKHLRSESSFSSVDALVVQMKEDCIEAVKVLKSLHL